MGAKEREPGGQGVLRENARAQTTPEVGRCLSERGVLGVRDTIRLRGAI